MAKDTRQRLIRATSRLLRRQGYAATGLNQIMSEAEAPKGSMYFHFPGGKEQLAVAAIDHFADRLSDILVERLAGSSTVSEAVAGFFDADLTYLERTDFREGCPVAAVALEVTEAHEELAEATRRALRRWTDLIAQGLESEGHTPEHAHGLATVVVATIEGTIIMSKAQRSTQPLAVARDTMLALLAPPATPEARAAASGSASTR